MPETAGEMYLRTVRTLMKRRIALGSAQLTVASSIGVSRQALGAWEAGEKTPSFDNFMAWVHALGMSLDLSALHPASTCR